MTVRLGEHVPEVLARVESAPALLLFLDFDGTLAPIAPTPPQAMMPEETRILVAELSQTPGVTVAVMTGRAIKDAREKMRLGNLIYAGNHGMEISGGGIEYVHPEAEALRSELNSAASALARSLEAIEGVEVEDKGLTASVHYRGAAASERERILHAVEEALERHDGRLCLTQGRMVFEIRPFVEWNKGAAAAWLRSRIHRDALPVCVGDDATDEDAFRVLADGVTVKVGCGFATVAGYCVDSVEEVSTFLRWIASTLRRRLRNE
jgi:trehalose-phosphatase